ncbi:MAG: agmatine deiminase family protein [Verrucomicrobiota bacterium]|nr:agmatine deiminase family protein [Verrucomicrobiota bacterium]
MQTPASLGYRMPAEWEPHAATWLSWPRREGISFPGAFDRVMPTFREMVAALVTSEPVCINVMNGAHEAEARAVLDGVPPERITYYEIPSNEPWCRDHGPMFLTRDEDPRVAIVDWGHNAWGGKYPPFDLDDAVPTRIAQTLALPVWQGGMILEGGSIDVNGSGACLTTESCLLNPNRNPEMTRGQIEQRMRDFMGVREIFWLSRGTEGDDTDGHIDNLARFVRERTVLAIVEQDRSSANYEPLQENFARLKEIRIGGEPLEIVKLPTAAKVEREGLTLPMSYANFYIANRVVLVPTYHGPGDAAAIATIQSAFPQRRVVPIDCRELIWGLGAFHCLTQQQPAVA